jgi:hypothetical protein
MDLLKRQAGAVAKPKESVAVPVSESEPATASD